MSRTIALTNQNFETVLQSLADTTGDSIFYQVPEQKKSVWLLCVRRSVGVYCDD
jgi:hypothetical protein